MAFNLHLLVYTEQNPSRWLKKILKLINLNWLKMAQNVSPWLKNIKEKIHDNIFSEPDQKAPLKLAKSQY